MPNTTPQQFQQKDSHSGSFMSISNSTSKTFSKILSTKLVPTTLSTKHFPTTNHIPIIQRQEIPFQPANPQVELELVLDLQPGKHDSPNNLKLLIKKKEQKNQDDT